MKGFILAAGFGERMLPITNSVAKPLLPVGNLPLIAYAIKLLAYHNIKEICINLHHLGRQIREALGDGASFGVKLAYSEEPEILGTGGGLKRMHDFVDDTLVVINSDTVLDFDLHAVLREHRARGALATMVLRQDARRQEFGQIEIDAQTGQIRRLVGAGPAPAEPVLSCMFTGVHVLQPRFLEYIPPDVHTCIIRYGYSKALSNHEPLYGTVMQGYWADAGMPSRYYQTNADALTQAMHLRYADPLGGYALTPKRDVADAVRMGHNVHLGPNTQLQPPLLLGDSAQVGDRASVGPCTIVGAQAHIGKEAQLRHCILLEGARVEANERLDHMLVGKKARLSLQNPAPAPVAPGRG